MKARGWSAALVALLALVPPASGAVEDVPFVTTPDEVVVAMLELAGVKKGDYVVDLGSCDGRIVIAAAKRFGANGLGVEKDAALVARSIENARKAGVAEKVRFVRQDLFKADLTPATVVTLYLMPDVNLELRPLLLALKAGTRIVSHRWDMGDWKPDRSITVETTTARGMPGSSAVHLWVVPADLDGVWCGTGNATGTKMLLAQRHQRLTGNYSNVRGVQSFEAAVEATRMAPASGGRLTWLEESDALRVDEAAGPFAPFAGATFTRSCCGGCY